jgi:hypothetical protein
MVHPTNASSLNILEELEVALCMDVVRMLSELDLDWEGEVSTLLGVNYDLIT